MKRTYLITGGAGFIGSHLCDALLARKDQVVVLDNLISGNLANLTAAAGEIRFVKGDIRDICVLAEEIGPVDTVVHLAALISGYDSLKDPQVYNDVNITGLLEIIKYIKQYNVERIVFASSSTVYGDTNSCRFHEDDLPNPVTVYALTKLMGEHILKVYSSIYGFSYCSLRLFNVYGPRQAVDHPYANVTCKFSHAAANGLGVRRYGDGEQTRDFIYIDDVVKAFLNVLDQSERSIYNVGTGTEISINQLIRFLENISGNQIPIDQFESWPNDVRRIRADTNRITKEFDFCANVGIKRGLAETMRFFAK